MTLERARRAVDRALEGTLAILLAFMVVVVLWQVTTRFVLRAPASGTEEMVRFALLWLSLLGASYGFGRGVHLSIDLLATSLPPRYRRAQQGIVLAGIAGFALSTLVAGGGRLARMTLGLGQSSAALAVERGYVYLVLPLSGLLIAFYVVADLVALFRDEADGAR